MSSVIPGLAPDQSVAIPLPLRPSPAALATVRARFRELLAGCPDAVVEDAVQVMDALVTSAYQHGQAPRQIRLTQLTDRTRLHIEVDRHSPPSPAILLIHRLTSAWGIRQGPRHTTMWADLTLHGDSTG